MATLLFPLYIYPAQGGEPWKPLVQAVQANRSPVLAVVNPSNGPGKAPNRDYLQAIGLLDSAGIPMAGYVFTKYGARALEEVEADLTTWSQLYPSVKHVFVDNMAAKPGYEEYYSQLSSSAKSSGHSLVVGNPGVSPARSYFGTVDVTVIYENAGYPSSVGQVDPSGWYQSHRSSYGFIAHSVPTLDEDIVRQVAGLAEYVCVTETYHALPPYLSQLVACLAET